jgi:hypothetical protein
MHDVRQARNFTGVVGSTLIYPKILRVEDSSSGELNQSTAAAAPAAAPLAKTAFFPVADTFTEFMLGHKPARVSLALALSGLPLILQRTGFVMYKESM